jgi:hypothetical protein
MESVKICLDRCEIAFSDSLKHFLKILSLSVDLH